MLGTHSARLGDALLERLACPEDPNTSVAWRNAVLFGKCLDRGAGNVDGPQGFAIVGFQGLCQPRYAGADHRLDLFGRLRPGLEFMRKSLDCAVGGAAAAELIDGRIAQQSVEPGNDALVSGRLFRPCDNAGKRILQNIFRQGAIADPALEILQEGPVILQENVDWRLAEDARAVVIHVSNIEDFFTPSRNCSRRPPANPVRSVRL
jgi:hypothetical protein